LARQIIVPTRNIAVRLGDNAQFDGIKRGFYQNFGLWSRCLGRVNAEEAVGELIVSRCDGAVDLEVAKHALDAVTLTVCCSGSLPRGWTSIEDRVSPFDYLIPIKRYTKNGARTSLVTLKFMTSPEDARHGKRDLLRYRTLYTGGAS
jgi:hypothetical protein